MTTAGTTVRRTLAKLLARAGMVFAIFIAVLGGYAGLKIRWADKQVDAFSRQVVIGMPAAGLEAGAKNLHLHYRRLSGSTDKNGRFMVWQGFAFKRRFCIVEYRDGTVVTKNAASLD
jgi:hypothetical protein